MKRGSEKTSWKACDAPCLFLVLIREYPRKSAAKCIWRSELESNQPLGFFKPTLIHLSYPTGDIADCLFPIADWLETWRTQTPVPVSNRQSAFGNRQCLGASLLLIAHLFHDITVIVHVHEEVL